MRLLLPSLIARVIEFKFTVTEIVMVRLQGDFAKPFEKRFNYKNCFDALFRVRLSDFIHFLSLAMMSLLHVPWQP